MKCSGLAGCIGSLATNPFYVLQTRQTKENKPMLSILQKLFFLECIYLGGAPTIQRLIGGAPTIPRLIGGASTIPWLIGDVANMVRLTTWCKLFCSNETSNFMPYLIHILVLLFFSPRTENKIVRLKLKWRLDCLSSCQL